MNRPMVNAGSLLVWTEEIVLKQHAVRSSFPGPLEDLHRWAIQWSETYGQRRSSHRKEGYLWVISRLESHIADIAFAWTITDLVEDDDDHRFVIGFADRLDTYRRHLRQLCDTSLLSLLLEAHTNTRTEVELRVLTEHPQMVRGWQSATAQIRTWLDGIESGGEMAA